MFYDFSSYKNVKRRFLMKIYFDNFVNKDEIKRSPLENLIHKKYNREIT